MQDYIALVYFDFRNKGRTSPPIEAVGCVAGMSHMIYVALSRLDTKRREEVLNYFNEWASVTPSAFDATISKTLSTIYDHENIRAIMVQSGDFLRMFSELLERLAELEFIGQHRENIVISERPTRRQSSSMMEWISKE